MRWRRIASPPLKNSPACFTVSYATSGTHLRREISFAAEPTPCQRVRRTGAECVFFVVTRAIAGLDELAAGARRNLNRQLGWTPWPPLWPARRDRTPQPEARKIDVRVPPKKEIMNETRVAGFASYILKYPLLPRSSHVNRRLFRPASRTPGNRPSRAPSTTGPCPARNRRLLSSRTPRTSTG